MATPLNRRLARLILGARAAIAWERLWPALAPMAGVLVVFIASAWMGLWVGLAPWLKVLLLGGFALAFVAAGWRLLRLRLPERGDAMRRLETDASLEHRPLAAYEDRLAVGNDPVAEGLWRVHRRRAEERLGRLRVPVPRADLAPSDPYAIRSVVGIVGFIGLLVGAGALAERLITPFDFTDPTVAAAEPQFRLDAWVTPPSYTGRSPLFLSAATRVETGQGIRVPAGSILTVRGHGAADLDLYVSDAAGGREIEMAPAEATVEGAAAHQATVTIDGSMAVEVRRSGATVEGWQFVADADTAPTVRYTEAPLTGARDQVEVRYELQDDYGIASARALVAPVRASEGRRPLVEDPSFPLTLPGGAGLRGAARTMHDLTEHPYAGQEVTITLEATDGVGQIGLSDAAALRLPAKIFVNPMAKAIVEQRAVLAMDAEAQVEVLDAIDLLLLEPEKVGAAGAFLAVRAAYTDLLAAATDDELRAMLPVLWDLANLLESGGMSDAERALQAAQERLREALERGASDEEIARLMDELREAMQQYMQALANEMRNQPQQQMDPNAREMTSRDLDDMLRRMEELAQQGRHEEAAELLAELQQMMQNLQMAQPGQQGDPMGQEGRTLDELGQMIQRQQELMDETYGMEREGQQGEGQQGEQGRFGRQPRPGQQGQQGQGQQGQQGEGGDGMTPSERAEALQQLREQQQALREELAELMRRLEEQGFDPGQRLGDAEGSMGDAGEALGESRPGDAVGEQGEALQALREGAQSMAQQFAESQQPGGQPGEDQGAPMPGPPQDPLGRARREGSVADTSRVEIPDEVDIQRARRILQELRDRLGDRALPRIERDYLESLLP